MKKCKCSHQWTGYGAQPREREVCDRCGEYLHCCNSCGHFDAHNSVCKIEGTDFIGNRNALNYCGEYEIKDSRVEKEKKKVDKAMERWEALFSK